MKHALRKKITLPRFLVLAIVTALGVAGITLIGNGLWIKAKAELAQILLNQAFERKQASPYSSNAGFRPWSWADITPIARLDAPRLNKSAIVLNDASGEALAFGPGHLTNTPYPGERGTSVLAAHRDSHFSWIRNLQFGDILNVERADGRQVTFNVRRSWIARFDQSGINADSSGRLLVLSTCYPFDTNNRGPMRYLVEAEIKNPAVTATLIVPR